MSQEDTASSKSLLAASTMDLCTQANAGCQESLELLIKRHLAPLANWTRGRLPLKSRSLMDTEDIVQEVLIGTVKQLPSFEARSPGALRAYLRRAVLNRIGSELRRPANRSRTTDNMDYLSDSSPSPLENLVGSDTLLRYETALGNLAETDRDLIIARVELRLTYAEIARDQGRSSPDAVRMAVSRALIKLAEEMSDE